MFIRQALSKTRYLSRRSRPWGMFRNFSIIADKTIAIFEKVHINPSDVDSLISTYVNDMTTSDIAVLMYRGARKKFTLDPKNMSVVVTTLEKRSKHIDELNIAKLLYGLRQYCCSDPSVRRYVRFMNDCIRKSQPTPSSVQINMLAMALGGLRQLRSDHECVLDLINLLRESLDNLPEDKKFSSLHDWYGAVNALQSQRSESLASVELMCAIFRRKPYDSSRIGSRGLAMLLLGFQGMSSNNFKVRFLIKEMTNVLVENYPVHVDVIGMGNMFYSMQRFDADHIEVRALLEVVTRYATHTSIRFDGLALGASLYGLQTMSAKYPEVRQALRTLHIRISAVKGPIYFRQVCSAMYGLRNMIAESGEVKDILREMSKRISECRELSSQGFVIFSSGWRIMSDDEIEVRMCVSELAKAMRSDEGRSLHVPVNSCCKILHNCRHMSSRSEEVQALLHELNYRLRVDMRENVTDQNRDGDDGSCVVEESTHTSDSTNTRSSNSTSSSSNRNRGGSDGMPLEGRFLANAFFGLQGFSVFDPYVVDIMRALISHCESQRPNLSNIDGTTLSESLRGFLQEIENVLSAIKKERESEKEKEREKEGPKEEEEEEQKQEGQKSDEIVGAESSSGVVLTRSADDEEALLALKASLRRFRNFVKKLQLPADRKKKKRS